MIWMICNVPHYMHILKSLDELLLVNLFSFETFWHIKIHGGQTKFPDLVFATQWSNEGFKFTSFIWGNFYGSFAITRT